MKNFSIFLLKGHEIVTFSIFSIIDSIINQLRCVNSDKLAQAL